MSTLNKKKLFIPRSVKRKQVGESKSSSQQKIKKPDEVVANDDCVKELSSQQRWPDSEEPVCVICGKYGEYICDETDEDVCSIECKLKHLQTVKQRQSSLHEQNSPQHNEVNNLLPHNDQAIEDDFDKYFPEKTKFHFKSTLSKEQNIFFREKLEISVSKETTGLMLDFSDIFTDNLLLNITSNNYNKPTTVQMQAIPICLSSQDVLVSSETTSGKTACFLIPIIAKIQRCVGTLLPSHSICQHPIALILAPTRELCMQIEEQAKALSNGLPNMKTALLIGGMPVPQQLHRLRHKIQIVIGTPGRINDILSKYEEFSLSQIKIVVIDEVDVMFHMGFHNQIEQILEMIPRSPQFLMFSATIPGATETLARKTMKDPIFLSVGRSGCPNNSVEQLMLWVDENSKKKKLFSIIDDGRHFLPPVLIFVESKIGADMLCDAVNERYRGLRCETLHSDKQQDMRSQILSNFLTGSYDILIATNVMGRGINLLNVKQVLLFDMPKTLDEYIHQIGRAGNLGNRGYAITFINNSSKNLFLDLKNLFDMNGGKLPDEITLSPYLKIVEEKRQRQSKYRPNITSKESDEDNINAQSLIEILTKRRKRK